MVFCGGGGCFVLSSPRCCLGLGVVVSFCYFTGFCCGCSLHLLLFPYFLLSRSRWGAATAAGGFFFHFLLYCNFEFWIYYLLDFIDK